eukprot:9503921-Pyramimonas_sp.AAC.1
MASRLWSGASHLARLCPNVLGTYPSAGRVAVHACETPRQGCQRVLPSGTLGRIQVPRAWPNYKA